MTPAKGCFDKEDKNHREGPRACFLSFRLVSWPQRYPEGLLCSWDPRSLHHVSATQTEADLLPDQCLQGTERGARAKVCTWLQPLPPRSSGGHSPSGKGDDATGGNAVSLGQRRALCQVPVK